MQGILSYVTTAQRKGPLSGYIFVMANSVKFNEHLRKRMGKSPKP